ncbi:MAG TPA: regulatory iron-sulfur-containing complex subunit RicT [bacterium]|nr:regulatory iron-sulfur-containing complex subunit RicT [bacterium]HPS29010.1 regulatory iron-sulfur-containing complex subunit RicT [bacterium]
MEKSNNKNYRNRNFANAGDISEEEFRKLQELEINDEGFKDEESPKHKKAGAPIAPLGGGNAVYFDFDDAVPQFDEVIAIQFQTAGKVYWYFYPEQKNEGKELVNGDVIVAYSERGMELATVLNKCADDFKRQNKINFIKNGFIRKARKEDLEKAKKLETSAKQAADTIEKINRDLGIKMKVIKVKYTLDDSKAIFYFSANGRVDFRELIKRLAYELKRRIEMRQIGVRDTTKLMGGLGPCGMDLCCSRHMHNFLPVSIKMAKDQNLSLNPNKISGICGRLFCCLGYENPTYEKLRAEYPEEETPVIEKSTSRKGYVKKLNVIVGTVTVSFPENYDKKEKYEEKIFPKSSLELVKGQWLLNPVVETISKEKESKFILPVIAKEKELFKEKISENNEERKQSAEKQANENKPKEDGQKKPFKKRYKKNFHHNNNSGSKSNPPLNKE